MIQDKSFVCIPSTHAACLLTVVVTVHTMQKKMCMKNIVVTGHIKQKKVCMKNTSIFGEQNNYSVQYKELLLLEVY